MKVGIIGCGGIAPSHIQVYKKLENVDVTGLCDLNLDRAKILAARFKIEKTFQNYWDMFEREDLDLVDICTPVTTHAKIVCDTAKAVPAILVEKPMALNLSECEKMIKATKKHDSKLCIGHNQIFSPHVQNAKSIIDSGNFDLLNLRTTLKADFEMLKAFNLAHPWNVSPEQRGIVWEVCCHHAYLQLYFLHEVKEVYAVGSKNIYPVYDDFAVLLRTAGEPFGIIEISWISNETEVVYEFRSTAGKRMQIHLEFDYFLRNSQKPPFTAGLVAKNILVDEGRLLQKWLRFGISYFRRRKSLPTFNLISRYVKCIKQDLPPPVSPEDGKNTINLLECIEKSLNEQRPIEISR